jgi:hypothetical protein
MRNFVGYHNAEKMGYSLRDAKDPFAFVTRKAVGHLVGARVWAITGEGQPRRYFCAGWFRVDRIEPSAGDPSERKVRGTVGRVFKPMIRLNELPWFPRFRQSQSNFSLGLQAIKDELVPHLEALEALAAGAAPANKRDLRSGVASSTRRGASASRAGERPEIKCMSIKDPWITMIGEGLKPYELRKRNCHHRGMLVLCSSAARSKTVDASRWPQYDGPKGMALYVVDVVDCYPATPKHAKGAGCRPSEGEWVWELRNVRKLSKPVPVKGSLSFYAPTRALLEQLREDGFIQK